MQFKVKIINPAILMEMNCRWRNHFVRVRTFSLRLRVKLDEFYNSDVFSAGGAKSKFKICKHSVYATG